MNFSGELWKWNVFYMQSATRNICQALGNDVVIIAFFDINLDFGEIGFQI